ncbi:PepSY domain-containing protein [Aestuariivirga sp.]|uniref:PepSY domain-containing protein n=1 Tax=Aestuariivirga sp. TaxID=2650926 RepID=UPI00391B940E
MVDRKAFLGLVTLGYLVPAITVMPAGAAAGTGEPDGGFGSQHGGGMSGPVARPLPSGPQEAGGGGENGKPKPGAEGFEPPKNKGTRHGGGLGRQRNPTGQESVRAKEGGSDTPSRRAVQGGRDRDDWQIRAAVRRGDAEPLRKILSVVRKRYDGKVVRITLGGRGSGLHYRIRILASDDRLIEVKVNARTASILSVAGL